LTYNGLFIDVLSQLASWTMEILQVWRRMDLEKHSLTEHDRSQMIYQHLWMTAGESQLMVERQRCMMHGKVSRYV
jgi:cell division protein FtsL